MMSVKKIIALYITIIFLLVVLPINGKNSKINHSFIFNLRLDYVFHSLIFFPWMGFFLITNKLIKPFFWLLIGLLLAIMSEVIQFVVPYRTFNINDLIANCCGVLSGLVLLFFHRKKIPFI